MSEGDTAGAATERDPAERDATYRTLLRFGWWSLLVYLTFGILLESLHALKLPLYLDLENSTRRLLWTLAHAHGTLLSVIVLCFAAADRSLDDWPQARRQLASRSLRAAAILMPSGFFLGGLTIHAGDPGLGVLLVFPGGLLLLLGVFLIASRLGLRD